MRFVILLCLVVVVASQFRGRGRQPFRGFPPRQSFRSGGFGRPRSQGFRGGGGADGTFGGSEYHYSWLHGASSLTGDGARNYCRGLGGGWAAVGISSGDEYNFLKSAISSQKYIWTGGSGLNRNWRWDNGEPFRFTDWSHTGGNRRPQPDNREGNEACLAILNNFYRDGIKYHDVACYHEKPTICERKGGAGK